MSSTPISAFTFFSLQNLTKSDLFLIRSNTYRNHTSSKHTKRYSFLFDNKKRIRVFRCFRVFRARDFCVYREGRCLCVLARSLSHGKVMREQVYMSLPLPDVVKLMQHQECPCEWAGNRPGDGSGAPRRDPLDARDQTPER